MRQPGHLPPGFMQPILFPGGGLIRAGGGFVKEPPAEAGLPAPANCLSLIRANSEYASITDAAGTGLDGLTYATIQGWEYFTELPTAGNTIVPVLLNKYATAGQRSYLCALVYIGPTASDVVFQVSVSDNGTNAHTNRWAWVPSLNTWYNVAAVIDTTQASNNDQIKFILNGSDQGAPDSVPGSRALSTIYSGTDETWAGRYATSYRSGRMADLRFYSDVARTEAQIAADYNQRVAPDATTSIWLFDNDLTDENTTYGNDLTDNNTVGYAADYPYS